MTDLAVSSATVSPAETGLTGGYATKRLFGKHKTD